MPPAGGDLASAGAPLVPSPRTAEPSPQAPPPERALVGGELPDEALALLTAELRAGDGLRPGTFRARPVVIAVVGGVVVLVILLVTMTVLGLLL